MTWIILEGIDKSGKSTVAELYKSQGFELVHMSAPDKKYKQTGYSGPSYLDDMLDLYMDYDGRDVVFDRSVYGECVWPHVYGREPALSDDDFEILREFEDRNETNRILMIDPDTAAHWKRCVDNNEPLNQVQFKIANTLYTKLAHKYSFSPKQLGDFNVKTKDTISKTEDVVKSSNNSTASTDRTKPVSQDKDGTTVDLSNTKINKSLEISGLDRLEKANAISAILSKRIIKQRGGAFDDLEGEVANFLKGRLEQLLGNKSEDTQFSDIEVQVLKLLCKRFIDKDSQDKQKPRR